MTCPQCRGETAEATRFCQECGAALEMASSPVRTIQGVAAAAQNAQPIVVSSRVDPLIGRTLNQRYRLTAKLGEGGFGTVYRALQLAMEREVAVKILHTVMSGDPAIVARFRREAQAAANLRNAHTIVTHDFDHTEDGLLYIVTELLRGVDLLSVLKREGALAPVRAVHIADQICESLAEAHAQGIVHRDVKSENIFLEHRDDDPDFVKVLDFGIAKIVSGEDASQMSRLTAAGQTLGTVEYMAPEQLEARELDGRTDLYALGALLYHMLSGHLPFTGSSPAAIMAAHIKESPAPMASSGIRIAPDLEALVFRCLAKKPAQRPASATELRKQLRAVTPRTAQKASIATEVSKLVRFRSFPSYSLTLETRLVRPKRVILVATVACALLFALAGGLWFALSHLPSPAPDQTATSRPVATPETAPLTPEPLQGFAHELFPYVPAEFTTALSLDIATLRKSALGPDFAWMLSTQAQGAIERFGNSLGVDVAAIDRLVLATNEIPSLENPRIPVPIGEKGSVRQFFLALQGRYSQEAVARRFESHAAHHKPERDPESGVHYIHSKRGHVGFLPNGTLFATGGNPIRQVLGVLKGTRGGLVTTASAAPLLTHVGYEPQKAGLAAVGYVQLPRDQAQLLAARVGVAPALLSHFAFGIDFPRHGTRLRIALRSDNAEAWCNGVSPKKLRAEAGLIPALDDSLARIQSHADNGTCVLSLSLTESDVAQLRAYP